MDVPDAGPDLARVAGPGQLARDLHVGAGGLQGDDVRVEFVDRRHDRAELGVAHVGVDLGVGADAGGGEAEGLGGPVQVGRAGGGAQREGLAQGGLVDLDDGRAGGLQVGDLVAQGEGDLAGGVAERLVVADEGPGEHGDGAGEHALDRAVGEPLGVAEPVDGHRVRAGDVPGEDRRAYVPGAVGLHPAVPGGQVAGELFGEVLDHVVAFGLAVHQDVQSGLLLEGDDLADLGLDALAVGGGVDPTSRQVGPGDPQFGGLREGADGGGRQRRQGEPGALGRDPDGVGLGAAGVGPGDGGGAGAHRRVSGDRRVGAGGEVGAVGGEVGGDRAGALAQAAGEQRRLGGLLLGEGEPAGDLRVQLPFGGGVQGDVQQ